MKSTKLMIGLFIFLLISDIVFAIGQIGDPCDNACDCFLPYACVNGTCGEKCYSHSQCEVNNFGCGGTPRGTDLYSGTYCGNNNECIQRVWTGESCDQSKVCPECECDKRVCVSDPYVFIDNLDNDLFYCNSALLDCFHQGSHFSANQHHYLADQQNVYYCAGGDWSSWSSPVCQNGQIWNIQKYPLIQGDLLANLPGDACISQVQAPEFPAIQILVLLYAPIFTYILIVGRRIRDQ